jgi:hypothetical protein
MSPEAHHRNVDARTPGTHTYEMPRTYSSIEKIRAELSWVNETPDPNRCGCRNLNCCERENHTAGQCRRPPETKVWTFRWEYFCGPCREYEWDGSKAFQLTKRAERCTAHSTVTAQFQRASSGNRHVVAPDAIDFRVNRALLIGTLERVLARWALVLVDNAATFPSLRSHRQSRDTHRLAILHEC